MSRGIRIVALLIVVGLVAGVWRWWNSPERQIQRALDGIAAALSHDEPATGLAAVSSAANLQEYLSEDAVIDGGSRTGAVSGRTAVVSAAARAIAAAPALRVEFVDVRIALDPGGQSATVDCTVSAAVQDRAGQETVDAREVMLTMNRVEGRWVVSRATVVQVLEPIS